MWSKKIIWSFKTFLWFSSCDFLAYQEPGTRGRFPGNLKNREIAITRDISRTGIPASHPYVWPIILVATIIVYYV